MRLCDMPLSDLVGKSFECQVCGRVHSSGLLAYKSGPGIIRELPGVLRELSLNRPFVISDKNTYKAAGESVIYALTDARIPHKSFSFDTGDIEPDEQFLGALTMAFDPECDCILAVGSGVINDLSKVLAHAVKRPQVVVGTAPSMDGYASNSSAMHVNGVKTTMYNACPAAIVCDTDVVKNAPMRLIWAGLGDMLAKYVSICEWRIAHLVIDEYYCEEIAALVRRSLKKCVSDVDGLMHREPAAVEAVFEGLTTSGIAMAFAKDSRPASGIEHYFSHLWEMMARERGTKADLHGIQVGVGTLSSLKLYEWVRRIQPDKDTAYRAMESFSETGWQNNVRRVFGKTAGQILAIEDATRKNAPERRRMHIERILDRWDDILNIINQELPAPDEIEKMMDKLSMPKVPMDLGISTKDTRDAFVGSRDIRDKYILSSLLFDMGLLDEAAERVRNV